MKKTLLGLALVVGGLGLASCTTNEASAIVDGIGEEKNIYAFEAISTSELLSNMTSSNITLSKSIEDSNTSLIKLGNGYHDDDETNDEVEVDEKENDGEPDPIVTNEIDSVDKYLAMIDKFVGVDNALTVTYETSDNPDYANKCTYVATDISGARVTYVLYFNEVLYEEDTEAIDSSVVDSSSEENSSPEETSSTVLPTGLNKLGHGEGEHEFNEESEDEIKYLLSGLLVVGDVTYNVEGKKVIEDNEEVLKMYSFIDRDNYVKVSLKTEDEQQKFVYEVVSGGQKINKTSIKVETEDNKVKISLKFVEGEASGEYRFTTEVVDTTTYIKIKYEVEDANGNEESGNIRITGTYDVLTDTTTYTYDVLADGHSNSHEYKKDHHGKNGTRSVIIIGANNAA